MVVAYKKKMDPEIEIETKNIVNWSKFLGSRNRQMIIMIVLQVVSWSILGFFFISRGFLPELLKLWVNEYMWIFFTLMIISAFVWMVILILIGKGTILHGGAVLLQEILYALCFIFSMIFVIAGIVLTERHWGDVLFFPKDVYDVFQIFYIVFMAINWFVIPAEMVMLYRMYKNSDEWVDWRKKMGAGEGGVNEILDSTSLSGKLTSIMKNQMYYIYVFLLFELLQSIFMIFFLIATSYKPYLLEIMVNEFFWIYVIVEFASIAVWMVTFMYFAQDNKVLNTTSLIAQGLLHLAHFGYLGFYAVSGWMDYVKYKGTVGHPIPSPFQDFTSRNIQLSFCIIFTLCMVIVLIEFVMLFLFHSRFGKSVYDRLVGNGEEKSDVMNDVDLGEE